jgi:hypothetical protein
VPRAEDVRRAIACAIAPGLRMRVVVERHASRGGAMAKDRRFG